MKASARRGSRRAKADGESDLLAKIAEMPDPDRAMAERIHAIIKASAPASTPRTWYGMPAYAKDGNVVCFFQPAQKFKTRYATLGFSDKANLDDGVMWPVCYALAELTPAAEKTTATWSRKRPASAATRPCGFVAVLSLREPSRNVRFFQTCHSSSWGGPGGMDRAVGRSTGIHSYPMY